MAFEPGRRDGGRPPIGPEIKLRVSEDTIRYIDYLLYEAHRRYERIPRIYRTRSGLIRHLIDQHLDAHHDRILKRPEPSEEGETDDDSHI